MASSTMTGKQKAVLFILLILTGVGIWASFYLYTFHLNLHFGSGVADGLCTVNEGLTCEAAASSPWAKLFGLPIAAWGAAHYMALLGLLTAWIFYPRKMRSKIEGVFTGVALFGVIYSLFLAVISATSLDAWCPMCMVLWVVNVAGFFLIFLWRDIPFSEFVSDLVPDIKVGALSPTPLIYLIIFFIALMTIRSHYMKWPANEVRKKEQVTIEVDDESPAFGAANAPVKIIEFSDYHCPHCKKLDAALEELLKKYPKKLGIYFINFPMDQSCNPETVDRKFHLNACDAALSAICAGQQNKFREMHTQLFQTHHDEGEEIFREIAVDLGLDMEKFDTCLTSPETLKELRKQVLMGVEKEVEGTPSYFINGYKMVGFGEDTETAIRSLVESELDKHEKNSN